MGRETVVWGKCEGSDCGKDVPVKVNVSGRAYYDCPHCGRHVKHTWQKTSDAYLAKLAPKPAPSPAPGPVPAPKAPAPAPVPNPPPAPVKRSAGTVLG